MRKLIRRIILSAFATCLSLAGLPAGAQSPTAADARVIIKFRNAGVQTASAQSRVQSLSQHTGLALRMHSHVSPDMQVLRATGISSSELARRLARQPDVEYAVEDKVMQIAAVPNDPLYTEQWYLRADEVAGINAQAAWDVSTGSSTVVVAVLDTGVRFDHEDLSSKLLPGYDFISDTTISNDGDGRDADASDPGDSTNASSPSSWHGTRVAGIIGAQTNNSLGIAGVAWQTRLLPVRVLGIGGGFESDIVAGMRWAAGLPVPGVPNNPTPAKVLNLSLGGGGTCDAAYLQAIADVTAQGAIIVAAAGNATAVLTPGNCAGVLGVAGVRHVGTKVGYSSFGPEVGISAPAGNCVNVGTGQQCLFPIDTTVNLGVTAPGANGYTNDINPNGNVGTSFSTPLASGVLALMSAVNPALMSGKAIERLKLAARPFPAADPSLPTCPATDTNGECNCTTTTCGAGLLDAPGALTQAMRPVANIVLPGTLTPGAPIQLDGSSSAAIPGASIATYSWTVTGGVVTSLVNANQAIATVVIPTAGVYTVTLNVTDSNGKSDQTTVSMTVGTPAPPSSPAANSGGGGGGGGALSLISLLGLFALAALTYRTTRRRSQVPIN